jgi:ribosomal protein S18 acetylase RimI-like enzyme
MAAGTAFERLNPRLTVRLAQDGDAQALADRGFELRSDHMDFVAESEGALVGRIAVATRAFESEMLALKVCSIDAIAMTPEHELQLAQLLSRTLDTLAADGYRLVTCRQPETGGIAKAALQKAGFKVLERLVTLSRPLIEPIEMPAGVTLASPDDAEGCAAIAREVFTFDRFHADPQIEDAAADRLKAQWVRNSVKGRADAVFVTREGGKVTGFNACMRANDKAAIDLIGVSSSHRGQGLGRALTLASIAYYTGKTAQIRVGTQSNNTASLALYGATGFRTLSSAITLHAHLS